MEKYQNITDFIRTLYDEPSNFIPLHAPTFNGNEKKYLNECIDSTFVSSVGKFVDEFELRMAEYTGAKKAVVCVNGTNALQLALQLVGVESNDEVITQPLTFIATANAIAYCGAHPVFIDVDKDTMGLSADALKKWLEENVEMRDVRVEEMRNSQLQPFNKMTGKRIGACVPMHTFGHACRIDEIIEICNKYHIEVVEDAAESLGSYYKNQHTGTFGKVGILSFNGNKVMTTGGGGMLLFNDDKLAEKAKHLSTQAKVPHMWEFIHDNIGYNYRMPNLNAAVGLAQLEQLPEFLENKRETAKAYKTFFSTLTSTLTYITEPENCKSNYWLNAVICENKEERDKFLTFTNEHGVMTRPIWELMNRLPMFKNCQCGDLSNSEWLADRVVNIPSSVILD